MAASLPGASPGHHGVFRRHAARAAVRPHRRRHRDDLVQYLGTTSITLQFDLDRDINGAARDVEAGINAARTYLPANLPANPTYRKVNPADSPIWCSACSRTSTTSRALR